MTVSTSSGRTTVFTTGNSMAHEPPPVTYKNKHLEPVVSSQSIKRAGHHMQFVGILFDQRISFKDLIPANYIERDMQPPILRASGHIAVVHESRSPNACRRNTIARITNHPLLIHMVHCSLI